MQLLKTDWQMNEIVKPGDFNRIGKVVNRLGEKITGLGKTLCKHNEDPEAHLDLREELANKANILTEPIHTYDLEFNTDYFTKGYRCDYSKNALNQVSIALCLHISEAVEVPLSVEIGYLPEGFRPSKRIVVPSNLKIGNLSNMVNIDIDPSGALVLFSTDNIQNISSVGTGGGVFMCATFNV